MNLADYLSELLGQHDEVSVPGLGYFVRVRVNGHYNDKEGRFYPPYHQVKFVPQPREDDTFAQYIADKKNISLASSKYFAEKFISRLKEDAARGKYLFADLGSFYTDQGQLVFKPNDKIPADPAFYGYPQIDIYKTGQPLHGGTVKPVLTEKTSVPVVSAAPVEVVEQQQYFEEETERKRPLNVWLVLLIAISVIALALFGVYKFYPPAFDKVNSFYNKIMGRQAVVVPVYRHDVKTDSTQKAGVNDTSAKTSAPLIPAAIDTLQTVHFEVIAEKFKKWQKAKADAAVAHYKALGLDAKISTDAPGPMLKITVGTYFAQNKADSARQALINAGQISKYADHPQKINPQK